MIPFIDLRTDAVIDRIFDKLRQTYERSDFILGSAVSEFEDKFASLAGCRYAIGVNSGLDALLLALKALEVGPGDEVITVPNSFVASAAAIHLAGAKPVFVDVGEDYNLDPSKIEQAITRKTKAILPVHLTGTPADMTSICEIANRHRLSVVEDAAQAICATLDGKPVGSFGHAGCFSLHPLKNLHVWGDGGIITTSDSGLVERLRRLRNHGLRNRDECEQFSFNSRLDSVQAAVGLVLLETLQETTHRRRENAQVYNERLKHWVRTPHTRGEPVYHVYQVQTDRRDALAAFLGEKGIGTKVHYPIPIHLQPAAGFLGYKKGDFPVTERLAETILSIPIRESLTAAEVNFICDSVGDFFGNEKAIG